LINYSIRQFQPAEAEIYKAIRLEALQNEPGFFGNSHATEEAFEQASWRDRLENPFIGNFGLYADNELIGLTSIVRDKDKPSEAYMTQSYIRKPFRGQGLSRMLYEARLAWAKAHGIFHLIIGHRESNITSKRANQHYGFQYSHKVPRNWPDGTTEDMLYYTLEL
jgi:GNAT superfamily N-acetyltransferase